MTEVLFAIPSAADIASSPRCASPASSVSSVLDTTPIHEIDNPSLAARTGLCHKLATAASLTHAGDGEAFFVTDLGDVQQKYTRWVENLPTVEPFYAVKCNSDPVIVETLAALGVNFDCASKFEMELVLSLGVAADRIIFAHPCKSVQHLRFAKSVGVTKMTFDNACELEKIAKYYPAAELVLRILVDDSKASCRLGLKFGADLATCASLFQTSAALGLNVIGVSFHVGSGASDASAYGDAVTRARVVFDIAAEEGFALSFLDIGGGFPGHSTDAASSSSPSDGGDEHSGPSLAFEDVAASVNSALDIHFSAADFPNLRIIGEPGRYFVSSASSLAVSVISKRRIDAAAEPSFMYYVNDGVYGSFNNIMFDHAVPQPELLLVGASADAGTDLADADVGPVFESSLWGPTCDSIDCLRSSVSLPELVIGDWLVFHNMGAYTSCAASTFNGFRLAAHYYTRSSPSPTAGDA